MSNALKADCLESLPCTRRISAEDLEATDLELDAKSQKRSVFEKIASRELAITNAGKSPRNKAPRSHKDSKGEAGDLKKKKVS